ncbi:hypothetical protein GCM10009753_75680 [Streptantibioticus ferralitis]
MMLAAPLLMVMGPMAPTTHADPKPDPCVDVISPALKQACEKQAQKDANKGGGSNNPCDQLSGVAKQFCKPPQGTDSNGKPCADAGPISAYCKGIGGGDNGGGGLLDNITGDCKSPPPLEAPGDGILGGIDSGPARTPTPRDPGAKDATSHLYEQYGYAGLHWNTYDLGCGGSVRDPNGAFENWMANDVFTWAKTWTALTVQMRQKVTDPSFLGSLDPMIEQATKAVHEAIFDPWIGPSLVLLGGILVFQARKRDLPRALSGAGWALIVMTVAAGVFSYPIQASHFADSTIKSTVGQIDQHLAQSGNGDGSGDQAPATAHGNMLVRSVLYEQWLRGELGSSTSPTAQKYGMALFDSQALTWAEDRLPQADRQKVVATKNKQFQAIAATIQKEDPAAYGHLTGHTPGRLGAAVMSCFGSIAANTYSLLADLIIFGGLLLIRFVIILLPAACVVGAHERTSGVVRNAFTSIMAAVINVPLFSLCGGLSVLATEKIMASNSGIPGWMQIVLLLIIDVVLWALSKPFRRFMVMVNPNRDWATESVSPLGAPGRFAKSAAQHYLTTRYMRKLMRRNTGAIDDLNDTVESQTRPEETGYGGGRQPNWGDWWDSSTGASTSGNNPTPPPGGPRNNGGGSPDLYGDYETDTIPSAPHGTGRHQPLGDGIWDVDGWEVWEADPVRSGNSLPPANTSAPTANGHRSSGAPTGPVGNAPLPSPRPAPAIPAPARAPQLPSGSATAEPQQTDDAVQPVSHPRVVQPQADPDGHQVYVLYNPDDRGYVVRDDRTPDPSQRQHPSLGLGEPEGDR